MRPTTILARLRPPVVGWAGFLITFLLVFTFARMARIVGWDDIFHLAQMGSFLGDGDLLLQDDVLATQNPPRRTLRLLTTIEDGGALANTFSVGPAVVGSSYLWPLALGRRDLSLVALRPFLAIGALGLVFLTLLAMREVNLRLGHGGPVAGSAALAAMFLGPMVIYGPQAYLGSHLPGVAAVAFALLAAVMFRESGAPRHALLYGLAAGGAAILRWQDCVVVAAFLPEMLATIHAAPDRRRRLQGVLLALAAASLVASLQLLTWHKTFGEWLLVPQGSSYMHWSHPHLSALLFSGYHGLLAWAPGLAVGLLGLVLLWRRGAPRGGRLLGLGSLLATAVALYVSACPEDWWAGASYGPRRLAALTPLAALGWAMLLPRLGRIGRLALVGALALWTVAVTSAYINGFDDVTYLVTGHVDRWNPLPPNTYDQVHWTYCWGPLHFLRPGFTFHDSQHNPERIVGAVAVGALLWATLVLWRLLSTRRWLQRSLLALVVAWVGLWLGGLALWVRPNRDVDRLWEQVVRAQCPPAVATLPRELQTAARPVLALRALYAGDERRARELEASTSAPGLPLGLAALRDAASETAAAPLAPPLSEDGCQGH